MATKKITGARTLVNRGELGAPISTPGPVADSGSKWYRIEAKDATASGLPDNLKAGMILKNVAADLTLVGDDIVTPITDIYICHTTVDVSAEEGTVETTDSCSEGYNEMILDGFVTLSGTIGSFARFEDGGVSGGKLETNAKNLLGRFMDQVLDEATDMTTYTLTERDNSVLILMICLDKSAAVGEYQEWIITPAIISAMGGLGGGIKDVLSQEMTWTKGEGPASSYTRKVLAGDVL